VAELEEQLARLAAQRSDAVAPLDPAVARVRARRNARRRATWIVAVAACVVALLVAGGLVMFAGSDGSPSVHTPAASTDAPTPTTAAPTTAVPTTTLPVVPACAPVDGADVDPKAGDAVPGTSPAAPVFTGVQVQASDCLDVVVFEFGNGTPAWSAANEPSGSGANEPLLVVRFRSETAAGSPPPPSEIRPDVPPSGVLGVTEMPQSDGSRAWSIGALSQGDVRSFRVVVRDDFLAVEIVPTNAPRTVLCTDAEAHLQFSVPAGWFVDVTPAEQPCTRFAPEPFPVCTGCDGPFPYGIIGVTTPTNAEPGPSSTVLSSIETTVGGRPATVREIEATGYGLFTAGYRTYEYVVDWAPQGTLSLGIGGDPGPDFDAVKAGLDAIAASVRRLD
jgi:hypothetical protein